MKRGLMVVVLAMILIGCGEATATASPSPSAIRATRAATARPGATYTPTIGPVEQLMGTSTAYAETASAFTAVVATATAGATAAAPPILRTPTLLFTVEGTDPNPQLSPDGRWVSAWFLAENGTPRFKMPGFYDLESGEVCYHPDLSFEYSSAIGQPFLLWGPDGSAVVVAEGESYVGEPCGSFSAGGEIWASWQWSFSPDGRYREESRIDLERKTAITTITDAVSGDVLNRIEWRRTNQGGYSESIRYEMLEQMGDNVQWIGSERVLIKATDEQGPLLARVGGNTVEIAREWFGLSYSTTPPWGLQATGAVHAMTGDFHLLLKISLTRPGPITDMPLLLYHSETGEVQRLSYGTSAEFSTRGAYHAFSPDGLWLVLNRLLLMPDDTTTDWLAPVDGRADEAIILADSRGFITWSGPSQLISFPDFDSDSVIISTFPEGRAIQAWTAEGYRLHPLEWLPGGKKLVMSGLGEGTNWALFLAEVLP